MIFGQTAAEDLAKTPCVLGSASASCQPRPATPSPRTETSLLAFTSPPFPVFSGRSAPHSYYASLLTHSFLVDSLFTCVDS